MQDIGSGTQIIEGLLPYGSDHGDVTVPTNDDGDSEEISIETEAVIFGFSYNRLYVSHIINVQQCVHVKHGVQSCGIKPMGFLSSTQVV